ncbi:pentapeptide repeat-containing protein [Tsukamurella spumae]|uniref:Pentapeptide repeat-containing protein n=1 Tax=Tsukamurella spumae TaxID=44753 RepID=A0A846X6S2_9ACTN|nr:pentapeptide repeat-containing protein [Tsukamurella spumae]NKY19470.1 pentapeptide repeat-containing protein [Tsukamurella spumae]
MFNANLARAGQRRQPLVTFADGSTFTTEDWPNSATDPFPLEWFLDRNLRGATFQNVYFDPKTYAGIPGHPLTGARFINCTGLRLSNAYLDGTDFIDCHIVDLVDTDMRSARIESSEIECLHKVNLSGAVLRDVFIDGTNWRDRIEGSPPVQLMGRWAEVDLSDTMIDGLRTNQAYIDRCDLSNAVIKNSFLTSTKFTPQHFSSPILADRNEPHVPWENTRWHNVRLDRVDFGAAEFVSNDFRGVNLAAADIDDARFDYSSFDIDVDLSTDRALNVVLAAPGVHLRADPHGPAPADPAAHMTVTIDDAGRSPNDPPAIEFEVPGTDLEHALAAAHRRLGPDVHTEITSRDRDSLDATVKDRDGQTVGTVAIAHDTPPPPLPSNNHGLARGHEAIARSFPARAASGTRTVAASSTRPASSTAATRGPIATASHFER